MSSRVGPYHGSRKGIHGLPTGGPTRRNFILAGGGVPTSPACCRVKLPSADLVAHVAVVAIVVARPAVENRWVRVCGECAIHRITDTAAKLWVRRVAHVANRITWSITWSSSALLAVRCTSHALGPVSTQCIPRLTHSALVHIHVGRLCAVWNCVWTASASSASTTGKDGVLTQLATDASVVRGWKRRSTAFEAARPTQNTRSVEQRKP